MSAIDTILLPLSRHFDNTKCVELRMSTAQEVTMEIRGEGKVVVKEEELTQGLIEDICKSLANINGLSFNSESNPKLSCVLPQRHRFECLVGSSVQTGLSLAIRCKHPFVPTWEQVGADKEVVTYLEDAIHTGKNIIVSGATNTGKTTLLNKILRFLPDDRRLVAIEDTPELEISRFKDGVGLLAEREETSNSGMINWRQLYDHCMRITPDHIIFGEISTSNSFAALGALNSGVTGFMCTIHAESAKQAITRKFEQNIAWSGQNMPNVPEFLAELIDVVIQIKRNNQGVRKICEIYEPKKDNYFYQKEVIDAV